MFAKSLKRLTSPRMLRDLSTYGIKFFNIIAAFVVTLLLARSGGPAVLGSYALVIQTVQLLTVVAVFGMDQILIREVASRIRTNEFGEAAAHVRAHLRFVWPIVAGVVAISAIATFAFTNFGHPLADDATLLVACGFLVINAVYILGLALMRSLGNQLRAQIFDGLHSWPLAILLGVAVLAGWHPNSAEALLLASLCLMATVGIMVVMLLRAVRRWGPPSSIPVASGFGVGAPFMAISLLIAFSNWWPLFLVGVAGSVADAGQLRIAFQLAMPITVILATTSTFLAPAMAGDFRLGRKDLVRDRFRRAALQALVISAPLVLPLLIWPEIILRTLFGAEFAAGADSLRAIVAGQALVMVIGGPSGAILIMAGSERLSLWFTVGSALLLLILSALLLPRFGAFGMALAFAISEVGRAIAIRTTAERLMK